MGVSMTNSIWMIVFLINESKHLVADNFIGLRLLLWKELISMYTCKNGWNCIYTGSGKRMNECYERKVSLLLM